MSSCPFVLLWRSLFILIDCYVTDEWLSLTFLVQEAGSDRLSHAGILATSYGLVASSGLRKQRGLLLALSPNLWLTSGQVVIKTSFGVLLTA